ncbi:hypothetical protein [Actinophytocola sp. KF-1]
MPDDDDELPPYRAVLVVDAKGFGGNDDVGQSVLADAIPDVLALAFERAGLAHVWREALFPHNTGDGMGVGFGTRYLPAVVSRLFDALQDVLAERDVRLRAHGRGLRLRMRASLNVGPVRAPDDDGRTSVVGGTVITTHRLLDADVVRDLLNRSDPDHTFLAVALSERVFEDVVASGYATLPASRLVPAAVRVKEYTGVVHLYVPNLSGDLLAHGVAARPDERTGADEPPGSVHNVVRGGVHTGTTIQVGHLRGGITTHRPGD